MPLPPGFATAHDTARPIPPPAAVVSPPCPHPPNPPLPADLTAAQRSLLEVLDGGSLTVVETAALLELPVSAVRVLAAQLIDRGLVASRPPIPHAAQARPDLLERVADGLRALKL
ncbi:DUF742 domain-containing protein [Streptomyces sp. NBC_00690]|uniref:DUF742 domain-containing protein n=1 Tax=Streptomyces sp. NBC_00690 TaxID=2975808 RepID=UPI002E2A4A99|nr:DUF742 domain-containing protein [Streptomyces sp. NBC_00690]